MHELSIAENVLGIVKEASLNAHATKVTRIVIEIGRLSGIERDALDFALGVVLKDSIAAGAEYQINIIPAIARCEECGKEGDMQDFYSSCPACGSHQMEIISGKELKVASIEVETED
jgi:hydrogenase nickel incorporation protein HypA/HybF